VRAEVWPDRGDRGHRGGHCPAGEFQWHAQEL